MAAAELNFDTLRAARKEKAKKGPTVKVGGKAYQLPSRCPGTFVLLGSGEPEAITSTLNALFGEQASEILEELSLEEVSELLGKVPELYGMDAPKA